MICPKCKSDHAHRSHRKGVRERLASLLAYHPYRCRQCGKRFLQFRYGVPRSAAEATSVEREIRATRTAIRWKAKKREVWLYGLGLFLLLLFLRWVVTLGSGSGD
jgi:transposase-like protein